jgi:hypothetical protein
MSDAAAATADATTAAAAAAAAAAASTGGAPGDGGAGSATDEAAKAAADKATADAAAADAKATADKAAADAVAAAKPPEKYDLKLPANASLEAASLERIAAAARAQGLSSDAAQAAVALVNTEAQRAIEQSHSAFLADWEPGDASTNKAPGKEWQRQQTEWLGSALADPELGAGKQTQLDAKVALAGKAFEAFTSPEFRELLAKSGYGSHPELVRTFARIGEAMGEGSLVRAEGKAPPARTPGQLNYPNTTFPNS